MATENASRAHQDQGARIAIVGGSLAIFLGAVWVFMALPISDPVVFFILSPPILGGALALLRPADWRVLVIALALILVGAYLMLISIVGFFYLPAAVLLAIGAGKARMSHVPPTRKMSHTGD